MGHNGWTHRDGNIFNVTAPLIAGNCLIIEISYKIAGYIEMEIFLM